MGGPALLDLWTHRCSLSVRPCSLGFGLRLFLCLALFPPFTLGTFTHPSLAPEAGLGSLPRPLPPTVPTHSVSSSDPYPEALQGNDTGLFLCPHCPQHRAWLTVLSQCVLGRR